MVLGELAVPGRWANDFIQWPSYFETIQKRKEWAICEVSIFIRKGLMLLVTACLRPYTQEGHKFSEINIVTKLLYVTYAT